MSELDEIPRGLLSLEHLLDGETYRQVGALDGGIVRVSAPMQLEFDLSVLIRS